MFLTTKEEQSLQGENGKAIQLAVSVLVKIGEIHDADRMIRIEIVHVDASSWFAPPMKQRTNEFRFCSNIAFRS
ncbi:MAG: aconitase X [Promethearchaeota archaeon]